MSNYHAQQQQTLFLLQPIARFKRSDLTTVSPVISGLTCVCLWRPFPGIWFPLFFQGFGLQESKKHIFENKWSLWRWIILNWRWLDTAGGKARLPIYIQELGPDPAYGPCSQHEPWPRRRTLPPLTTRAGQCLPTCFPARHQPSPVVSVQGAHWGHS